MSTVEINNEIKVKELGTAHLFRLATIISKLGAKALDKIKEINERFDPEIKKAQAEVMQKYEHKIKNAKSSEETKKLEEARNAEMQMSVRPIEGAKQEQLGIAILFIALEHAESHLKGLLAELVDMTPEEFDKTPIDTTLVIIEDLIGRKDFKRFLEQAWSLAKKISGTFGS